MSTSETKSEVQGQPRKAGSRKRWIGLILAILCLVAVGVYLFFNKEQSRAAKRAQKPVIPSVPVVAAEGPSPSLSTWPPGCSSPSLDRPPGGTAESNASLRNE